MKDAILMAVSQKVQNTPKPIVLVGLSPHVIQALYSSTKRSVQLLTQLPMLTMSFAGMGCLAKLANVAPWNRYVIRSPHPCDGCHSKAMVVQLDSESLADVGHIL